MFSSISDRKIERKIWTEKLRGKNGTRRRGNIPGWKTCRADRPAILVSSDGWLLLLFSDFLLSFLFSCHATHLRSIFRVHSSLLNQKKISVARTIFKNKKIKTALKKFQRGLQKKSTEKNYAPNLSNIFAFACMSRKRNFASNTPSEPMFAPVSVKRSNLSEPENAECSITGCGCHE